MPRYSKLKYDFSPAPDIKSRVDFLVSTLDLPWLTVSQIHCVRSLGSRSRAYARIWGLPRMWQVTLDVKPHYVIEVLSQKFDHLNQNQKDNILLHELAHIPRTFSGALTPHTRKLKGSFHDKLKGFITTYNKNK